MALHDEIMRLRASPPKYMEVREYVSAFRLGHKQARHDAAELAIKADSLAHELREILEWATVERIALREQEIEHIRQVLHNYGEDE